MKYMFLFITFGYIILSEGRPYSDVLPVHPGVGGLYRGPNKETIIKGPDGSVITAEYTKPGKLNLPVSDKIEPIVAAEPAVHIPASHGVLQTPGPALSTPQPVILNQQPLLLNQKHFASSQPPILLNQERIAVSQEPVLLNQENLVYNQQPVSLNEGYGSLKQEPVILSQETVVLDQKPPLALASVPLVSHGPLVSHSLPDEPIEIDIKEPVEIETELVAAPEQEPNQNTDLKGPSGRIITKGSSSVIAGPASITISEPVKKIGRVPIANSLVTVSTAQPVLLNAPAPIVTSVTGAPHIAIASSPPVVHHGSFGILGGGNVISSSTLSPSISGITPELNIGEVHTLDLAHQQAAQLDAQLALKRRLGEEAFNRELATQIEEANQKSVIDSQRAFNIKLGEEALNRELAIQIQEAQERQKALLSISQGQHISPQEVPEQNIQIQQSQETQNALLNSQGQSIGLSDVGLTVNPKLNPTLDERSKQLIDAQTRAYQEEALRQIQAIESEGKRKAAIEIEAIKAQNQGSINNNVQLPATQNIQVDNTKGIDQLSLQQAYEQQVLANHQLNLNPALIAPQNIIPPEIGLKNNIPINVSPSAIPSAPGLVSTDSRTLLFEPTPRPYNSQITGKIDLPNEVLPQYIQKPILPTKNALVYTKNGYGIPSAPGILQNGELVATSYANQERNIPLHSNINNVGPIRFQRGTNKQ